MGSKKELSKKRVKKKKILFMATSKATLSGGQTMILNMLKNINRDRYDITLLLQYECPLSILAKEEGIEVRYKPFNKKLNQEVKNRKSNNRFVLLLMASSIGYYLDLKSEKYDIIWCENITMLILSLWTKVSKTKVIANMWSNVNSKIGLRLIDFIADYIIVEADFQLHKFNVLGRINDISKVYTQIDSDVFTSNYTREEAQKKQGFSENSFVVGFLGGKKYSKGYDILVDIAYDVIKNKKSGKVIFYIAGTTKVDDLHNSTTINKKLEQLEDNVYIENWILDKEQFYKSIDLFISTSRSEGLPGTHRESIGFKTPVLTTNVGGEKDILGNSEYIIEASNYGEIVNNFSEKIISLSQDQNEYLTVLNDQYSKVTDKFIGKSWVTEIEKIFEKI